jgi:hypothetical protein
MTNFTGEGQRAPLSRLFTNNREKPVLYHAGQILRVLQDQPVVNCIYGEIGIIREEIFILTTKQPISDPSIEQHVKRFPFIQNQNIKLSNALLPDIKRAIETIIGKFKLRAITWNTSRTKPILIVLSDVIPPKVKRPETTKTDKKIFKDIAFPINMDLGTIHIPFDTKGENYIEIIDPKTVFEDLAIESHGTILLEWELPNP